jgi:hypothetical protein
MPDNAERSLTESGKITHVTLLGENDYLVMSSREPVAVKLTAIQIQNRHSRSEKGKRDGLLPSTTSEAENVLCDQLSQQSFGIEFLTGRLGVYI